MQLLRGLAYLHTGIYGRSIWADLLSMAQSNETQLMSNRLPRPRPSWMKKKKSGNSCRVKNEKKCERENPSKLFGCCLFEVFFYIHICIYIFFFLRLLSGNYFAPLVGSHAHLPRPRNPQSQATPIHVWLSVAPSRSSQVFWPWVARFTFLDHFL